MAIGSLLLITLWLFLAVQTWRLILPILATLGLGLMLTLLFASAVVGTLNLFEAARHAGVERVVYASSAAVFGLSEDNAPVDESSACEPATHYGVFKCCNEGSAST